MNARGSRMLIGAAIVALCTIVLQVAFADEEQAGVWSFDKGQAGALPGGWMVAETSSLGTPATWQVIADSTAPSPPNAIAITTNKNYGRTFNLLIAKDTRYKDLEIEVEVHALTGKEDQGGGPVWRAKDANNYYIARSIQRFLQSATQVDTRPRATCRRNWLTPSRLRVPVQAVWCVKNSVRSAPLRFRSFDGIFGFSQRGKGCRV